MKEPENKKPFLTIPSMEVRGSFEKKNAYR